MFERFTDRARKVMALANQEAQRFKHEYIGTEHILLGLLKEGSGVGASVLKNLNVDLHKIQLEVEKLAKRGSDTGMIGKLPQTPQAKKVIEYSIVEARSLNCHYVGTEHLLLGLIRVQDDVAAVVLTNLGLTLDAVRQEVLSLLETGGRKIAEPSKALIMQAIEILENAHNSAAAEGDDSLADRLLDQIHSLKAILRGILENG